MSNARAGRFRNAIGRLIAEFLVIVVGVLVALAVDGYASIRADRARIETHLAQLESEIDEMAQSLEVERDGYDRAVRAAIRVVEGVTNPGSVPEDSLNVILKRVFVGRRWEPEATVINTMISSGDIALVSNRELQSEMNRFRERIQAVAYRRDLAEELFMDGYRAFIERADMLRWASDVFGTTPTDQRWDWENLSGDLRFRNGLYGMANGVRNHRAALDQLAGHIENLKSALEQNRAVR
jgi:hypothetical protein